MMHPLATPQRVGVLGAGDMAKAHLYALDALRHYYPQAPPIVLQAIAEVGRRAPELHHRFGFRKLLPLETFWQEPLDGLIIASPNRHHLEHLQSAVASGVPRIYVEKPLCCGVDELREVKRMAALLAPPRRVQVGFQFSQTASFLRAFDEVRRGRIGDIVSFRGEYLHGGYLDPQYRSERVWRLRDRPEGGAMVDLGSHVLSGLLFLLGGGLHVLQATQATPFEDVSRRSDLETIAILRNDRSAIGAIRASRIAAGCGDRLLFALSGTRGALRISSEHPDQVWIASLDGSWQLIETSNNWPGSSLPRGAVPGGWLRSLVHAHARFWGCIDDTDPKPDLAHALEVQEILNTILTKLDGEHA